MLTAVQEREEELRDLVLLLVELEVHGFTMPEAPREFADHDLDVLVSQQPSLDEVARFASLGKYLDALRLLFPTIEAFLNSLLEEEGRTESDFQGMRQKFEELVRVGRISRRVGYWGEVFVGRNKIVHGNIQDDSDELSEPLYRLVVRFLRTLVRESRRHAAGDSDRHRTTQPLHPDRATHSR